MKQTSRRLLHQKYKDKKMDITNLFIGKVVDNNDTKKEGRVQIYIEALMYDITDKNTLCPWARPFRLFTGGGTGKEQGMSCVPEKDSMLWCFYENVPLRKNLFYFADLDLTGLSPHQLFDQKIKSKLTGFASQYPDVKYIYFKNGICIGASSNNTNPEFFVYHPKWQIYIDKDGHIKHKDNDGNKYETSSTGVKWEDKNGNKMETSSSGIKFNDTAAEILK